MSLYKWRVTWNDSYTVPLIIFSGNIKIICLDLEILYWYGILQHCYPPHHPEKHVWKSRLDDPVYTISARDCTGQTIKYNQFLILKILKQLHKEVKHKVMTGILFISAKIFFLIWSVYLCFVYRGVLNLYWTTRQS